MKPHRDGRGNRGLIPNASARREAERLAEQGMPFQMAMAVAHGRMELSDALKRMAIQAKAAKLQEKHDLSRGLATQIAMGHVDLDKILSRRRLEAYRTSDAMNRSVLDAACQSGEPMTLGLHGGLTWTGRVSTIEAYQFGFVRQGKSGEEDEQTVHKLQAKLAWNPADTKKVRRVLKVDKKLRAKKLEPISRPQDRYSCSTKRLFRYLDEKLDVTAVTLEGDIVRGQIVWFSRFELGFCLKGDVEVVVFRHALQELSSR